MYSQKEHFHDFKTLIMINTNNPMLLKLINDHKLQQSEKNENTRVSCSFYEFLRGSNQMMFP